MILAAAAVAIVSVFLSGLVECHPDGAPDTACASMTPGHQGTAMREASTAVHRLQVSQTIAANRSLLEGDPQVS